MVDFNVAKDQIEELKESSMAIAGAITRMAPKIKENDFKTLWLDKVLHSTDEAITREWITKVACTPFDKVEIISDSVTVVATVPSFYASTGQYLQTVSNLNDYMATITNAAEIGKKARVNQLYEGLINRVSTNPFPVEDLVMWVKLAEYFNEKPAWLQGFKDLIEKYKTGNNKEVNTSDSGKKDNDDYTDFEPV